MGPSQNRPLMSSACLFSVEKLKCNHRSEKMQKQKKELKELKGKIIIVIS